MDMSQNAENLMRFYLLVVGMGIGCVIIQAIHKLCKIASNRLNEITTNTVAQPINQRTPRTRNQRLQHLPRQRTNRATPKSTEPTEQAESVAIQPQSNTGVALTPMLPIAPTQPLTPVMPETSVIEQTPILDESEINVDELK